MAEVTGLGTKTVEFTPCSRGEVAVELIGTTAVSDYGSTESSGNTATRLTFEGTSEQVSSGPFTALASDGSGDVKKGVLAKVTQAVHQFEAQNCNNCQYHVSRLMPTCPGAVAVYGELVASGQIYNLVPQLEDGASRQYSEPADDDAHVDTGLFPLTPRPGRGPRHTVADGGRVQRPGNSRRRRFRII